MKLKKEFITHTSGDEQLMISAGGSFNGMVRSNKTAAFIIDLLKEETTKEKIVSVMLETYDADEQVISADVDKVVDALRSIGAIDE
jgi:methyltransferase-like protein